MAVLSVAAQSPVLRDALGRQRLSDWEMADESGAVVQTGHLAVFKPSCARYFLVSLGDEALAAAMASSGALLYWLVRMEIDGLGAISICDSEGAAAGVIVSRAALGDTPDFPARGRLIDDILHHVRDVGARVGALCVAQSFAFPVATGEVQSGWRLGPVGEFAVPSTPAPPILYTCSSNHLYGATELLSRYCGLGEFLPIVGRVQHGWEPTLGKSLDALGESALDRVYVWSEAALARSECPTGIAAVPIGAPYLYLDPSVDAGPFLPDGLLIVPQHSIARTRIDPGSWDATLRAFRRLADERRFDPVTILLYWEDDNPDLRQQIQARGFRAASCGDNGSIAFLYRVRAMIRRHRAVASNAVCTAAMYALYEDREVYLTGFDTLRFPSDSDLHLDIVSNETWVAANYPGLYAGGHAGHTEALRELGRRRDPNELRSVLWGWAL